MENQEKVRKIQATPMRWLRFFRVKNGEAVYIGKQPLVKRTFCGAYRNGEIVGASGLVLVNPFRRVKTGKPVKRSSENPGQTHFVGDDCPGGHHELPKAVGSMNIPHGGEPHNCNNIAGPTS